MGELKKRLGRGSGMEREGSERRVGRGFWRRRWLQAEVERTERGVQEAGQLAGGGVGATERGRKCREGLTGEHPRGRHPWWEV